MTKKLIVEDHIFISSTPSKVWEVLVNPKFVAQWDELPEDFPHENMSVGSKVVWEHSNGGETVTKVIKAIEEKEITNSIILFQLGRHSQ